MAAAIFRTTAAPFMHATVPQRIRYRNASRAAGYSSSLTKNWIKKSAKAFRPDGRAGSRYGAAVVAGVQSAAAFVRHALVRPCSKRIRRRPSGCRIRPAIGRHRLDRRDWWSVADMMPRVLRARASRGDSCQHHGYGADRERYGHPDHDSPPDLQRRADCRVPLRSPVAFPRSRKGANRLNQFGGVLWSRLAGLR